MANTKMARCECCGITSSSGEKATEKYYNVLYFLAKCAEDNNQQAYMIMAAKEYLSNVTTSISSSSRPNLLPHANDIDKVRKANFLIQKALKLEPREQ